jgi:hypothetical protein
VHFEFTASFLHDEDYYYILPGVPPTYKNVTVAIGFHIYFNETGYLTQEVQYYDSAGVFYDVDLMKRHVWIPINRCARILEADDDTDDWPSTEEAEIYFTASPGLLDCTRVRLPVVSAAKSAFKRQNPTSPHPMWNKLYGA